MRVVNLIMAFTLLLVIVSCTEAVKYNAEEVLTAAPHGLQLDNGEKWIVDEGMMVSIKDMEKTINDFDGHEVADFKYLSKTTKINLSNLTSSCTMKGQSHDELHKWLMPFFDLNKAMKKTNKVEEGQITLENMKYQLFVFSVYFK